ncbi:hypothetical protein JHK87_022152 [Glycine soja]|nr:hypothetical protein JHK87_022152 [Glycine soja]
MAVLFLFSLHALFPLAELFLILYFTDSSASEWPLRDDIPYWFDQHAYNNEGQGSQDEKRWSSHLHSSLTQLHDSRPLYRTSSYPEQQRQLQHQLQHCSSEPVSNLYDQHFYDSETIEDGKRWSSHPHSSIAHLQESKPLYRTSSYPNKRQELTHFSSEPILVPKSSFTSYPSWWSKYMTSDEIESILRMQLAVTHCNDPYVDDYYHSACLAKKMGAKLKNSFCPTQIKEHPPRVHSNTDSHGFLQVDSLGRVSFLAIRQLRALLEVVSIPKGRKLLAKYLQLLVPGSELMRIVCMAIFHHLRLLFGGLPSDLAAAETTSDLAKVVCQCVQGMDLGALGACLAAVVCSSEQPPLHPLGSTPGDDASRIIVSVLERTTELFTDPHGAGSYEGTPNVSAIGSDASKAISREMPAKLLRASLPHTNDHQRKLLLDFAQRSVPVVGFNSYTGSSSGLVNSETVLS